MVEVLAQTLTLSNEPALAAALSAKKITTEEIIRQIKAGACRGQRHGFNLHDLIFTPAFADDCVLTTFEGKPIVISDKSGCIRALVASLEGQMMAVTLYSRSYSLGLKDGVVEQGEEFVELFSDPGAVMSAVGGFASELISDPAGTAQKYGIAIVGGMQENAYKYVAALERRDYREAGKLAAVLAVDMTLKVVAPSLAAGVTTLKTAAIFQKVARGLVHKGDGGGGKGVAKGLGEGSPSSAAKGPSGVKEPAVTGAAKSPSLDEERKALATFQNAARDSVPKGDGVGGGVAREIGGGSPSSAAKGSSGVKEPAVTGAAKSPSLDEERKALATSQNSARDPLHKGDGVGGKGVAKGLGAGGPSSAAKGSSGVKEPAVTGAAKSPSLDEERKALATSQNSARDPVHKGDGVGGKGVEKGLGEGGKGTKHLTSEQQQLIKNAETVSTAKPGIQATKPRDLNEQILWNQVLRNPEAGGTLKGMNKDTRFPESAGFQKMEAVHELPDGRSISIHYQYNKFTGNAYDMKITSPQRSALQPGPSIKE